MPNPNQYMRLFSGHLKMDEGTLTELFLSQLGNIYCAKTHLLRVLPDLADRTSFLDLQVSILEGISDIKMQLLRMDIVYQNFGGQYVEDNCIGIKSIMIEAYQAGHPEGKSPALVDMAILTHLRIIESIEITSLSILADIAACLKNEDVQTLLNQNLKTAINTNRIYTLISQEYIA